MPITMKQKIAVESLVQLGPKPESKRYEKNMSEGISKAVLITIVTNIFLKEMVCLDLDFVEAALHQHLQVVFKSVPTYEQKGPVPQEVQFVASFLGQAWSLGDAPPHRVRAHLHPSRFYPRVDSHLTNFEKKILFDGESCDFRERGDVGLLAADIAFSLFQMDCGGIRERNRQCCLRLVTTASSRRSRQLFV
jgi:hypothetical protein